MIYNIIYVYCEVCWSLGVLALVYQQCKQWPGTCKIICIFRANLLFLVA